MTDTADPNVAPADTLADVATTHSVTEAERAALAPEVAEAADQVAAAASPATPATVSDLAASAVSALAAADTQSAAPAAVDAGTGAANAAVAAAETEPPATAAVAPPGPALLEVPAPPRDFDAAFAALTTAYDNNDIDDAERDKQFRQLTNEQARYEGQKATIETHNQIQKAQFEAQVAQTFEQASKEWVTANQEFVANPIRLRAFQEAITIVDTQTGGRLTANELLTRASKIAFEAYGWDPAAHGAKPAAQPAPAAAAAALAGRQPPIASVPATLGDAPTSGSDAQVGRFEHLTNATVQEMEAAVARMSPAEQDAWLKEVDAPIR